MMRNNGYDLFALLCANDVIVNESLSHSLLLLLRCNAVS
jgi:hypothetical protein